MKSSTKTLLLWVVLIVLFVAFYNVYGTKPSHRAEPLPACETKASTVLLTWSVPTLLLVGAVFWFRWWTRKFHPMNEGVRLLNDGRALAALEFFEKGRQQNPKEPSYAFNMAVAQLHLWRLEASMRELEAAAQAQGAGQGSVAVLLPEHRATVSALLGRLGDARAALAAAPKEANLRLLNLAKGIVAAREGNWPEARQHLNSHEVKQLGSNLGYFARTLDAFCVERLGGELRHVDRVGLFGEASPDELRRHWPEFVAFIDRTPAW